MPRHQPNWLDPDLVISLDGLRSLVFRPFDTLIDSVSANPWPSHAGQKSLPSKVARRGKPLYTPAQRVRRDSSVWTTVQGILAPVQFLIFLISLYLVLNFLATGQGYEAATLSVVIKTLALYAIMITGSIWEKVVFGKYLFAPAFYWEDVFSMLVLALHTAYLVAIYSGWGTPAEQMALALAAYAAYVINAAQFVLKLRAARLEAPQPVRLDMRGGQAA
jgi:3-vinyl bacteriochlorophyllide hydratase